MAENLLDTIRGYAKRVLGNTPNPPKVMPQEDRAPTKENAWKQDRQRGWLREPLGPAVELGASLLGGVGTALSTYSPDAEAMIRKGGRTDLNMTHQGSAGKLLDLLTGRGHLSNPSIAIASGDAFPFTSITNPKSASLVLNPASHRFDPRLNTANDLANRDSYTTRQRWAPPEARLGSDSLRLTEGGKGLTIQEIYDSVASDNLPGAQQMLSILASPEFKSFAEYEGSVSGAETLSRSSKTTITDFKSLQEQLQKMYPEELRAIGNSRSPIMEAESLLERIRTEATRANKLPKDQFFGDIPGQNNSILWDSLRNSHSDYAELKVPGEVPLNSKTVSAVLISPYAEHATEPVKRGLAKLVSKAESKGIRAGTPEQLMPADVQDTYRSMAEQLSRTLLKASEGRTAFDLQLDEVLPKSSSKYLTDTGWLTNNLSESLDSRSLSKTYDAALSDIYRSLAFSGDTASVLTARDLDSVSTPNILKKLLENSQ